MGIVNVTPDSFSDGGNHDTAATALRHCERLLREGADILDLGGESTRPGSEPLPLEQERARVMPVLREAVKLGVPISVDTYKPEFMREALGAGADVINDIWALRMGDAVDAVTAHPGCGVVLMHMQGEPKTMQMSPMEGHALPPVLAFLKQRTGALTAGGVAAGRIVWDAGTGFGKTLAQNFELLAKTQLLVDAGHAVLAGWSRKSSLGAVTGLAVGDRLVPSVAAALMAVERGARIVRVHDVKDTVAALKVWSATVSIANNIGGART
jgi:dihydropteroate synthase